MGGALGLDPLSALKGRSTGEIGHEGPLLPLRNTEMMGR